MSTVVELRDVEDFRDLMKHRGVSVRELAEAAGVSPAFISHLRSPERQRRVSVDKALLIARHLHARPDDLWQVPKELNEFIPAE